MSRFNPESWPTDGNSNISWQLMMEHLPALLVISDNKDNSDSTKGEDSGNYAIRFFMVSGSNSAFGVSSLRLL